MTREAFPERPELPEQHGHPELRFPGYEPPLQLCLSDRTRKLGMKHIARIRRQLAEQAAAAADAGSAA